MEKTEPSKFTTMGVDAQQSVATARTFSDSVELCSKCCRKLDAEGKALRKAVKAAIRDGYGEDVALEKVDCFSLCPKGGQVVSTSGAKGGRRLVILQPDSDVAMGVEYLLRDLG